MNLQGKKITVHDMTLRDGMHPKRHQMTLAQMASIACGSTMSTPRVRRTNRDTSSGDMAVTCSTIAMRSWSCASSTLWRSPSSSVLLSWSEPAKTTPVIVPSWMARIVSSAFTPRCWASSTMIIDGSRLSWSMMAARSSAAVRSRRPSATPSSRSSATALVWTFAVMTTKRSRSLRAHVCQRCSANVLPTPGSPITAAIRPSSSAEVQAFRTACTVRVSTSESSSAPARLTPSRRSQGTIAASIRAVFALYFPERYMETVDSE